MLNREGLDVLVHPLTDNSYDDHSRYAVWLGAPVALLSTSPEREDTVLVRDPFAD